MDSTYNLNVDVCGRQCVNFEEKHSTSVSNNLWGLSACSGHIRMISDYGNLYNLRGKIEIKRDRVHFKGKNNIYLKLDEQNIVDCSETLLLYIDDKKLKTMDIDGAENVILNLDEITYFSAVFINDEVIYVYVLTDKQEDVTYFYAKMRYGVNFKGVVPKNCDVLFIDEYVVINNDKGATTEIYDPMGKKIAWDHPDIAFYGEYICTKVPYNAQSRKANMDRFITKINLLPRGLATKAALSKRDENEI